MNNPESPLDQVISLLKTGTDLKRLHSETKTAEKVLREASDLIDEHDLPEPWPQLVSYRLAHILFRSAVTYDDYVEIEGLLRDAARANCLGPLPRLYQLAAMSRLGMEPKKMKGTFESLLEEIDHFAKIEEPIFTNEDDAYDYMPELIDRSRLLTALQNNFFNMLELAAYFTGYPYNGFEGKGLLKEHSAELTLRQLAMRCGSIEDRNPYSDLNSKLKEWRLVGTVPGLATTAYPGEMALKELESRMEKGDLQPPCVAFRISVDRTYHEWNFNLKMDGDKFAWERVRPGSNHLLFMAAILAHRDCKKRGQFLFRIFHDDTLTADRRLRKWKERCGDSLANALKIASLKNLSLNSDKILLDDTSAERAVPEFAPNISVLGAMDAMLSYY